MLDNEIYTAVVANRLHFKSTVCLYLVAFLFLDSFYPFSLLLGLLFFSDFSR